MTFDPSGPAVYDGIYGLPEDPDAARVILVPVPWEPTTSYRQGTAGGPRNILEASRQVDLFDRQTGKPYQAGIVMLPEDETIVRMNEEACARSRGIIDAGGAGEDPALLADLARVNELSLALNDRVEELCETWLARGKIVGVVGGDHSTPYGLIRALARRSSGLGVLHVDAHADLRRAYEGFVHSHASIMFNVHELEGISKIVQVGLRDLSEEESDLADRSPRLVPYYDHVLADREYAGEPFLSIMKEIVEHLPNEVYLSFDIDGLEPALCPTTGTPVPGGLSFRQACALLQVVARSGRKIVGFDLNEVSGSSEWDGTVGARLLYKLIGFALQTRPV